MLTTILVWGIVGQAVGQDADEPIFRFGGRANLDDALLNALDELEAEAVQDVITQHELPPTHDPSQVSLVLGYGRSDVRSRLFGKVLEIAKTDPADRTANQQRIADAFTDKLQEQRIAAVEFAINEYDRWESSPCNYVPPEPFTYDPDPNGTLCDGSFSLSDLLTMVQPPTLEEFLAYGALDARKSLLGEEGAIVVAETQGSMIGYSALIAAGVAVVGAAALGALVFFGGQSLFLVGVGTLGAVSVSASSAFAAVLGATIGAVGVALVAIFIGVMQGIFVFTAAAIPDQLAEALVQAQQERPILHEVVATPEGVQELFYTFIPTTLPEFRSTNPPPALTDRDQCFIITDQDGNRITTDTISYLPWLVHDDDPIDVIPRWTTSLKEGWFVSEAVLGGQTINTRSLVIQFWYWRLDAPPIPMAAWRMGDRFLLVPKSGDPEAAITSDAFRFVSIDEDYQPSYLVARISDVDCTPPDISVSVDGDLGNNGWYVSDVVVDWEVADSQSKVFADSSCDDTDVVTDGIIDLVCNAHSDGGFSDLDVTIKRDTTPPSIVGHASPPANAAGWNNTPVTITADCDDDTSGVDSQNNFKLTFPFEGTDQVGIVGCADNAGNRSQFPVSDIDIDMTLPSITPSVVTTAPENTAGWYHTDVSVSFFCLDTLSGIDSCTGDTVLGEGENQSVIGTAVDRADNSNTTTVGPYNIDKTPPSIIGSVSPLPNASGWHNTNVTVSFTCDDALSGVLLHPGGWVFTTEGRGQSFPGTCQDFAGNSSSTTVSGINIDKTDPIITGSTSPGANGAGWNHTDVTVSFDCDDALSGIASCTSPATLGEGVSQSQDGTAFDKAGNSSSTTVSGISIDKTPPVITLTTPPDNVEYILNQVVYADWGGASDSLSGLDSSVGTVPSGQAIDTATAGEKSFEVKAVDVAGNETNIRNTYIVLAPSDSIDNLVDDIKALVTEGVLKPKQVNGIKEPLDNALRSLEDNQLEPACSQLDDFIAEVEAKTPRPLDTETASALITTAQDIATVSLRCP